MRPPDMSSYTPSPIRSFAAAVTLILLAVVAVVDSPAPASAAGPVPWGGSQGAWSQRVDWPVNAIHAAVDRDGKVITYGKQMRDGGGVDLWTPSEGLGANSHDRLDNNTGSDLFCSFIISDPAVGNGSTLLLLGGNSTGGNDNEFALRYTPGATTPVLDTFNDLNLPRWYAMGTTLWDGSTLIQGGTRYDQGPAVITPEILRPGAQWQLLAGATSEYLYGDNVREGWYYPRTWTTPAGKIFGLAKQQMYYIDTDGEGSLEPIGRLDNTELAYGSSSAAVMFEPGKVLQVGGNGRRDAMIIDLNFDPPVITPTASMFDERWDADATVLPDGRVLVSGGTDVTTNDRTEVDTASLRPEIWDPSTGNWTRMAQNPSKTPRLYHSTALLLPDGSVFTGGGGDPGLVTQRNAEVFYPPYLFAGNGRPLEANERPALAAVPTELRHNQRVTVAVQRGNVTEVVAIRNGASTHSTNSQIRIPLAMTTNNGTVTFTMPKDGFVAPPGDYMIFALDGGGVPSEAQIVRLRPSASKPSGTPAQRPDSARLMPRNLRVTATSPSSISLAWDAPEAGADMYALWVDGRWVQSERGTSITLTKATNTGLAFEANRTYLVEVTGAIGTQRSLGVQRFATTVAGGDNGGGGGDDGDDDGGDDGGGDGNAAFDVAVNGTNATATWTLPNDPAINGTWIRLNNEPGTWIKKDADPTTTYPNLPTGQHTITAWATYPANSGRNATQIGTKTITVSDDDGGDDDGGGGNAAFDVAVNGTNATATWTLPNDPAINGTWIRLNNEPGTWIKKDADPTKTFPNLPTGQHTVAAWATYPSSSGRNAIQIGNKTITI